MNGNYLIPANSKKSQLILGLFNMVDLIVFGTGVSITMGLLLLGSTSSIGMMILILLPALITGFLVLPVPNYHNVMTFIGVVYKYFTTRRNFIWKGWCASYGEEDNK